MSLTIDEDIYQALILAGNYNDTLNIGGIENLLWTVEFCDRNGANEIIVQGASSDLIHKVCKHITTPIRHLDIECESPCEVLRYIRESPEDWIKGTFIMVHTGTVSNIDIRKVVQEFNEQKEFIAIAIFTHNVQNCVIGTNKDCLTFFKSDLSDIYVSSGTTEIFTDLHYPGIFICNPAIVNIPESDSRILEDMIHLIINNNKLYGANIGVYVADGYARRVNDMESMYHVTMDIVHHKTYPLGLGWTGIQYRESRACIYKGTNTIINIDAKLESGTVLAQFCHVEKGVTIGASFIGNESHICENVIISESIIMSQCYINTGTVVRNSIVSSAVKIDAGLTIQNCYICPNMHVTKSIFGAQLKKEKIKETTLTIENPIPLIGEFEEYETQIESIVRKCSFGASCSDMQRELNSVQIVFSYDDVPGVIISVYLKMATESTHTSSDLYTQFQSFITEKKQLLTKLSHKRASINLQTDILSKLLYTATDYPNAIQSFGFLLMVLYDAEIIDEKEIRNWWTDERLNEIPSQIRNDMEHLIEFLDCELSDELDTCFSD